MGVKDEQIQNKKSSGQTRVGKAPRFNGAQFVQYELDKTQQAECKAWSVSSDELFDLVSAAIDDGYKFTVKWDAYSECYGVFMQSSTEDGPNAGYILTGRGSSPAKSIKQALYKHHTALDGDWAGYVERPGRGVIDD